jgi:hypothetical protein
MMFGGASYPMFLTVCLVCGRTEFYNAVVAGLSILRRWKEKGQKDG